MALFAIAIPVVPGKTEETVAFTSQIMGDRHDGFKKSREAMGVVERTFLQKNPDGSALVIVTLEGENPKEAFTKFAEVNDEWTNWFVEKVKEVHGVDLKNPPQMELPELVADSSA